MCTLGFDKIGNKRGHAQPPLTVIQLLDIPVADGVRELGKAAVVQMEREAVLGGLEAEKEGVRRRSSCTCGTQRKRSGGG